MSAPLFGVTPPISTTGPTPAENSLNDALVAELKAEGLFETEAGVKKRKQVLEVLQTLAQRFVYEVLRSMNMSEGMARDAGGKIFLFGLYRLGLYGPGLDIDTLVLVPKYVKREHFFTVFDGILRERPELEEITPVQDAFVPLIKVEFDGILIDLLCAKVDLPQVPLLLTLEDNNLLKNLDEKDLRALNGTRVTDQILQLVPKPAVFRYALRAIKLWAQRRAVYGNVFGFPGGVAWAMLVARICQLYPNAVPAVIVGKFFNIYCQWKWPEPVLLKPIEDGPLQVRVWNPRVYPGDRGHRMPVITPAYPLMCATHNITQLTQLVIMNEMLRALQLVHEVALGHKTWKDFFGRHDYFHRYKFYLTVVALTTGGNSEEQHKWSGFVESRLRLLVGKLEVTPGIGLAHPYVKEFGAAYTCKDGAEAAQVLAGYGTLAGEAQVKDLAPASDEVVEGATTVQLHLMKWYIGLVILVDKDNTTKKIDLQEPCLYFFDICKKWEGYDKHPEKYAVGIKYVKVYDLPNDVYEPGEERPRRQKKRKGEKKETGEAGEKRPRSNPETVGA